MKIYGLDLEHFNIEMQYTHTKKTILSRLGL